MISLVRVLLVVIAKNEHFDEMLWVNIYISIVCYPKLYRFEICSNFHNPKENLKNCILLEICFRHKK